MILLRSQQGSQDGASEWTTRLMSCRPYQLLTVLFGAVSAQPEWRRMIVRIYSLAHAPVGIEVDEIARIARSRCAVEECFQSA